MRTTKEKSAIFNLEWARGGKINLKSQQTHSMSEFESRMSVQCRERKRERIISEKVKYTLLDETPTHSINGREEKKNIVSGDRFVWAAEIYRAIYPQHRRVSSEGWRRNKTTKRDRLISASEGRQKIDSVSPHGAGEKKSLKSRAISTHSRWWWWWW